MQPWHAGTRLRSYRASCFAGTSKARCAYRRVFTDVRERKGGLCPTDTLMGKQATRIRGRNLSPQTPPSQPCLVSHASPERHSRGGNGTQPTRSLFRRRHRLVCIVGASRTAAPRPAQDGWQSMKIEIYCVAVAAARRVSRASHLLGFGMSREASYAFRKTKTKSPAF